MKTLLAIPFLAATAHAGQSCYSQNYPSIVTNWSQGCVVPKHDPALGTLESVRVTMRCTLNGAISAENPAPVPAAYELELRCLGRVVRPDFSSILELWPAYGSTMNFSGFDGTVDFGGTSGLSSPNLQVTRETYVLLQDPADLALFTATSPGEVIDLGVSAQGASTGSGPGALLVVFATSAAMQITVCYGYREICQSASIPSSSTNWQQFRTFAKHDPALGPLRAVRVRARTTLTGTAAVENPSPGPQVVVTTYLGAQTRIQRPDMTDVLVSDDGHDFADWLTPFDGTIDFGGTSGAMHAGVSVVTGAAVSLTSPQDLALFTAGAPGETITLGTVAMGTSTVIGGGPLVTLLDTAIGVEIDVCYDHSSPVVPFCFGDGSGASCPCGNASPVGAEQGCLNSFGLGGELRGSGAAEIGHDTLLLTASNLPATASALFFQGTSAISATFGDGLRCAGGMIQRLGRDVASGGSASFPPLGQSVSNAGQASVGATLHYQAWYRNAAAFCTPSTFNLTNGVRITW